MAAFLALDQGTTSSRALVFDDQGRVLGSAQQEIAQHFPGPGHVEHDPHEILRSQWDAAQAAHEQAGAPEIVAVGISNQRETAVVWDRATGEPVHRAIVWQDRRTAGVLEGLADHADLVRERTGLPLDPYFSAAKIAWILDHVPGARAAAARGSLAAGTVDAWLLHRLTDGAVFATEPSNASRTSLYDTAAGGWSDELCDLFDVPRACLPEVRPSAGEFGRVGAAGWPVRGVLGDQQAALFGQACLEPGQAKCTYGTGAFLLVQRGTVRPPAGEGLLSTVAWEIGGTRYHAHEGSVMVAGSVVQWLRDGVGLIDDAGEVEDLARSVPDSGGVVLVPAFAGLGSPHWDPRARGMLIGLTRGTGRAAIARAAIEAIACQVHEVVEAATRLRPAGEDALAELRVDGGASRNGLLLELQAGLAGLPVRRARQLETTALGAARIAMLGAGLVARPQDLPEPPLEEPVVCGVPAEQLAGLWRRWQDAVPRCKGWARD